MALLAKPSMQTTAQECWVFPMKKERVKRSCELPSKVLIVSKFSCKFEDKEREMGCAACCLGNSDEEAFCLRCCASILRNMRVPPVKKSE
jgi:hypothetical protein